MKCGPMTEALIGYTDGRANEAERHEVEAHLAACSACRTRADEFRFLWSVLDEAPVVEPSVAFDAHLRARIAAEPPRLGFWAALAPSPRLAFAVSLLLVLSVWTSSLPPAVEPAGPTPANLEVEFRMIRDLSVLEDSGDYEVLANFEALSELRPKLADKNREM